MKTVKEKIFWGAVLVFILCCLYTFLTLKSLAYQKELVYTSQANITVIPGGLVPTTDYGLLTSPTPSPTPDASVSGRSGIQVNSYVQISGTEGAGLNVRYNPGTGSDAVFVANDSEVFKVISGPVDQDGYVWWELSAPYDQSRQGWAAENYLQLINP
jgi:hypothetical protein